MPTSRLLLLVAGSFVLFVAGCSSEDDCVGSEISLNEYIEETLPMTFPEDEYTVEEGERLLRYIIEDPGTGPGPTDGSEVVIDFVGYTTDGDTIDGANNAMRTSMLSGQRGLIEGMQLGLPLIGEGGRIWLFIPSSLAYAANQASNICPNSDLIFEVDLVSFTNP